MNLFVHPSYSFSCPSVLTAVSVALAVVIPTTHTLWPSALALFTISQASRPMTICSEFILCFVRSSTSMGSKLPRPQCAVMKALWMPLISIIFITSRLKCSPEVGAVTAPSFLAYMVWKFSMSSAVASRLSMMYLGSGASPSPNSSALNSS